MRPHRLLGDGLPLDPRRERRSPTAHELRVGDLSDDPFGTELVGSSQGLVAAVGPVVVDRRRVDPPHPAQQAEPRSVRLVPGLRGGDDGGVGRSRELRAGLATREQAPHLCGRRVPERRVGRIAPGALDEHGGGSLAHPQARAPDPRGVAARIDGPGGTERTLQLRAERVAADAACEVVADVDHRPRPRFDAEHGVERRDPVRLGRRHGQALADVGQAALADPPDAGLQGVERREQEVALVPGRTAPASEPPLVARRAFPADPTGVRRAEELVDGRALLIAGSRRHHVQVHDHPINRRPGSRSRRRAPAPASRSAPRWP